MPLQGRRPLPWPIVDVAGGPLNSMRGNWVGVGVEANGTLVLPGARRLWYSGGEAVRCQRLGHRRSRSEGLQVALAAR